jgi:hypothetical protein
MPLTIAMADFAHFFNRAWRSARPNQPFDGLEFTQYEKPPPGGTIPPILPQ